MKVLVAPNAFKNSLTAEEAGKAIVEGLQESKLEGDFINIPIADGGDGSLVILAKYFNANLRKKNVKDPLGRLISARYAINESEKVAVIELAEASGLKLVDPDDLNPWIANTYGTGEIIEEVLEQGCKKIILTVGGSATTDGGLGILRAIGVKFFNEGDEFSPTGPCDFHKIDRLDAQITREKLADVEWIVLTDVENRLLGSEGAVMIYGPQKGIAEDESELFEQSMSHWEQLLSEYTGVSVKDITKGGASGGVPASIGSLFKAKLLNGADFILEKSGFYDAFEGTDLIITTEGQIDEQTGYGKGPGIVARYGYERNVKVIALCGQLDDNYNPGESYFTSVFPINSKIYSLNVALARTRLNLKFTATQVGNLLAM